MRAELVGPLLTISSSLLEIKSLWPDDRMRLIEIREWVQGQWGPMPTSPQNPPKVKLKLSKQQRLALWNDIVASPYTTTKHFRPRQKPSLAKLVKLCKKVLRIAQDCKVRGIFPEDMSQIVEMFEESLAFVESYVLLSEENR